MEQGNPSGGRPPQGQAPPQQGMQPPPMQHPPMYGYPMDPSWVGPMMPPHHHHGYHPHHGPMMDGIPLPPGLPGLGASTDPLEAVLGPFPCARLRGLPFEASLEDVLVFFQGLVVLDVVLHGAGEAFVIFANPMDFQMALQRDRQSIGRRYIEVFQGKRADYYAAIAAQHWHQHQQLQDLTTIGAAESGGDAQTASDPQAPQWTSAFANTAQSSGSQLGGESQGSVSGKGKGSVPQQAIRSGRGGGAAGAVRRTGGGIQVGEHTGYLRMRGLPFSSTKKDIFAFFKDYDPIEESIVLTYRSDGRATGEGYVAFESPDDAKKAMALHRNTMGSRYIELFISNKEEHGRALTRFGGR